MSERVGEIARRVAREVRQRYVFPDKGEAAAAVLEKQADDYPDLPDDELATRLTGDLLAVIPDQHLSVRYHADERPERTEVDWTPEQVEQFWEANRRNNYGVHKVERLRGNIGLLDLRSVNPAERTGATFTAAMSLLAHTDALLLDLRLNRGGAPSGVAFLCSFFFGEEPVHLQDVYDRVTDKTYQYWTSAYVPGPRYLDKPVFVLTAKETFSGAEELAYNLQQSGRATVIGETTRGGAHPTGEYWVAPHLVARVPMARSINAFSGTNWEGVGVVPDVPAAADDAFGIAYRKALTEVDTPEATEALADLAP